MWVIPVWLAGLHINRLPEQKRAVIQAFQREAVATIERKLAQSENKQATPETPAPEQFSIPQPVWQEGQAFIDYLQAEKKETHSQLAVMRYDLHSLALRVTALEARDASPSLDLSPEHLKYVYHLARQLRQQRGLPVGDILAMLAEHFRVEDVSLLPEKDWPAVLDWFASLLEE